MQLYVLTMLNKYLQPKFADEIDFAEWSDVRRFAIIADSELGARQHATKQENSGEYWLDPDVAECRLICSVNDITAPLVVLADTPTG